VSCGFLVALRQLRTVIKCLTFLLDKVVNVVKGEKQKHEVTEGKEA
jgi:hypothetical protein